MGNGAKSSLFKGIKNKTNITYEKWKDQISAENAMQVDIDKWNKKRSSKSHDAIYDYSGSGYTHTNPILRDKSFTNLSSKEIKSRLATTQDAKFMEWLDGMDKGLSSYITSKAFIGYRGAGYSLLGGRKTFEELQKMVGRTVRDTGHMSISTVYGHEFDDDVLYKVKVPTGKGIGAYIGQMSQHKSEAEYLFNRGTIFKVTKVEKYQNKPMVTLEVFGRY